MVWCTVNTTVGREDAAVVKTETAEVCGGILREGGMREVSEGK